MYRFGFYDQYYEEEWESNMRTALTVDTSVGWRKEHSDAPIPDELNVDVCWLKEGDGDYYEDTKPVAETVTLGRYNINGDPEKYEKALKNWKEIYTSLLEKGYASASDFDKELFEFALFDRHPF